MFIQFMHREVAPPPGEHLGEPAAIFRYRTFTGADYCFWVDDDIDPETKDFMFIFKEIVPGEWLTYIACDSDMRYANEWVRIRWSLAYKDSRLMGFKGSSITDPGYFYAPYLPIVQTPKIGS
jgi:hypothetical protein